MAPPQLYYSVGRNGTWTTEPAPESFFTDKGAKITDSRIDAECAAGIKILWVDGVNAGKLFPTQESQLKYLKEKGLV